MIRNHAPLFPHLNAGAIVITPTNRLANHVLAAYSCSQQKPVINKPRCLPYKAFLQSTYQEHSKTLSGKTAPNLLTESQLQHLWQHVLQQKNDFLINQGLFQAAYQAWEHIQQWLIDSKGAAFQLTDQTRLFQHWVNCVQKALTQLSAIAPQQITAYLLQKTASLPKATYIWYCFDDLTPEQQALQSYLIEQGSECKQLEAELLAESVECYAALDENEEELQIVQWISKQLKQNKSNLGVIIPDLGNRAKRFQRLFAKHLPGLSFNLSLGQPLSQFLLVSHALCWLELDNQFITRHQAHLLLSSPYIMASEVELMGRAQVRQEKNALYEEEITLARFIQALEAKAPMLAQQVKTMPSYPEKASATQWLEQFQLRLKHFGFPGSYSLNSTSYQCYQRFLALFDEFQQLAVIEQCFSRTEALMALRRLAESAIFQPKTQAASVQILGQLDGSGCTFDALWVCGLDDDCLPQKTRLSPFIPKFLQQEKHMPHASLARELKLAERQIARFQRCANEVVFSYAQYRDDKPNLPSPLISQFPIYSPLPLPSSSAQSSIQILEEAYQLPLNAQELITGGSALLADQAKCPFRAFATHRLKTKQAHTTPIGLTPSERGQLLHGVLEIIWKNLHAQAALLALSDQELQRLILTAIQQVLIPFSEENRLTLPVLVQQVEQQRLTRLVSAYLDWDKTRPPFIVEALEKKITLDINGLELNLRIDRLDRMKDGSKWVIDYKSSAPNQLPWYEERPLEPQLLLYSLYDEQIDTLVFAVLKNGQLDTKGISEKDYSEHQINKLKKDSDWQTLKQDWGQRLTHLAQEYKEGFCPPKPNTVSICQTCSYQDLCRVKFVV